MKSIRFLCLFLLLWLLNTGHSFANKGAFHHRELIKYSSLDHFIPFPPSYPIVKGVQGALECRIWDLEVKRTDCRHDGTFDVKIFFNHMNTGDFFKVVGSGHDYGTFKYSDPQPYIIKGLKGDCKTPYEFVILDQGEDNCTAATELGMVCCVDSSECRIWDLEVKHSDCRPDGTFDAKIFFKHRNTGDFFKVAGNGHDYGNFNYSDPQPYIIKGLKGDCRTPYEFVILDQGGDNCTAAIDLGKVCCKPKEKGCSLCDLHADVIPCNEDGNFSVILKGFHKGRGTEFHVRGNGHSYGTYKYSDFPIKIDGLKADCHTEYEFVVYDTKQEHCGAVVEIGKVCCDSMMGCPLKDSVIVRAVKCNEGEKTIQVSLYVTTGPNRSYDIFNRDTFLGFFRSNDVGNITIEHFPISGKEHEYIKICLNDHPDCCAEFEFKALKCHTATASPEEALTQVNYNWINTSVRIKRQTLEPYQVQILNLEGKMLLNEKNIRGTHTLSVQDVPAGYYLVRLITQQGIMGYSFIKSR